MVIHQKAEANMPPAESRVTSWRSETRGECTPTGLGGAKRRGHVVGCRNGPRNVAASAADVESPTSGEKSAYCVGERGFGATVYKPTATMGHTPRENPTLAASGGCFEFAPKRRFEVVEFSVEVSLEELLDTG